MKPNHESRVPPKQQVRGGKAKSTRAVLVASNTKPPTALSSSANSDFDDVADLFRAINQTKAQQKGVVENVTAPDSNRGTPSSHGTKKSTKSATGGKCSASSSSPNVEAKPVRDGLYHAPQKSVKMSDNEFFSGTWLKADQAATTAAAGLGSSVVGSSSDSVEASQELLRKEGVDRIVSLQELSKMLSRNAKAGSTPNCPFDCDCCF
ncbi:hypothetical protein ABB37_00444 [Leptomonas pyrrhocoris]|uniref:Uncharacterized protein n=1 Tax=Leptomonas pyrrhocoris TaxID=157538 RepID=A0A0N0VHN4_LEPPY|nr:hypothetical protein ABB37_00444 [Leptomonas pyrrhocoris]XP_015664642.1 hypothetical protein ABB37_00444 [Leptomonas pyrrhocoris]XP_015664643.1 hypothetical protein ABB37_00444 [Leptomonas pyrrhocoris]KPA86202.1 hypothetical protein ABB37_00444 [Leptomonas pyrrhocoris]KPA86203.1 hypothetical protein ABB37_00444 [Leptomonas pyrrhocoris]KPA86204.1 hypothetical protein ABB37_00444 [Leptomonas pyrrhocoris]|eukprot:XP_015664641.1 hypothetical protein ABB37_00444 [Leptomonas pyrrhocoris]